jgi:hypothetical protein
MDGTAGKLEDKAGRQEASRPPKPYMATVRARASKGGWQQESQGIGQGVILSQLAGAALAKSIVMGTNCSNHRGRIPMQPQKAPPTEPNPSHGPAAEHVSHAHDLLQTLRKRIGEHPELEEAIVKLETALSILTVKTGAML